MKDLLYENKEERSRCDASAWLASRGRGFDVGDVLVPNADDVAGTHEIRSYVLVISDQDESRCRI